MKTRTIFIVIGVIALIAKIYLNFSIDLIPGVNGGYYPLMVRTLLERGTLGFDDMPLLFYLNAGVIKLISLFGFKVNNELIINTVKVVDCLTIPLTLIPLYGIVKIQRQTSTFFTISITAFATLSITPLILTSDLQKNSLAILFGFWFIGYALKYLENNKIKHLLATALFLLLVGLTHFGTFAFYILYSLFVIFFYFKRKAVLPSTILIIFLVTLVALIDYERQVRLITFWNVLFEKPLLLSGMVSPFEIIQIIISWGFSFWAILLLFRKKLTLNRIQKPVVIASLISILLLTFPLIDAEYFRRLSLFAYIPLVILVIQLSPFLERKSVKRVSLTLLIIAGLSSFSFLLKPKPAALTQMAYYNLVNLNEVLPPERDSTIIIARHGLEWWVAWTLRTKVAQDKGVDNELLSNYKHIFIINQIDGFGEKPNRTPFHEPEIGKGFIPVHSTNYFKLYRFEE